MSFSTVQQWQFFRVPTADSSFTLADRYALTGVVQALSPDLSSVLKKQLLRYPVADTSFDASDKFALAGYAETFNTGSTTTDVFELTWTIDPTWTEVLTPAFTGAISRSLEDFGVSLIASRLTSNIDVSDRTITVAADTGRAVAVSADTNTVTVDTDSNTITPDEDTNRLVIGADDEVTIV